MSTTRTVESLGGYQTTVYRTALGEFWRMTTRAGPAIKGLSPHSEPWTVILTAKEARDAAAVLIEIANEIEGCPRCQNLDGTITDSCYCREEAP